MTDDDTIQRPKGRHNNSVDLSPESSEPVQTERRSLFSRKKNEGTQEARQDLTFDTVRHEAEPVRPVVEDVPAEPVQAPKVASIDLGATTARTAQQRTMDMDSAPSHSNRPSVDLGASGAPATPKADEKPSMDLGSDRTASSVPSGDAPAGSKGRFSAILPFGSKTEEDRKGTWAGTGYSATDDQAHRNVRYQIPSFLKQTMIVFMVQMKLFSKMKWTYLSLFLALLIPIIVLGVPEVIDMLVSSSEYSNIFIAYLLAFLPLFLGLITSVMCGKQLPSEFKERTAYMNVSLPMSRHSFYLGKYLAGFVMCLGIFMFAYGMAVATAMTRYDSIFTDLLMESMALTIVAVFAYTATAYCLGSFMKRGSSMVPFMLMTIVIPSVCLILYMYYTTLNQDLSALLLLPPFLGEAALGVLGASTSASVGILALSYMDLTAVWLMAGIGVVWGLLFLILGMYRTMRREM